MTEVTEAPTNPLDELSVRQRRFVEEYVKNGGNGTAAVRVAYSPKSTTAATTRSHMLRKNPKIKAAIEHLMRSFVMGPEEVVFRLARQARGTLEEFLDEKGRIDLVKAREGKALGLLKRLTVKEDEVRIELHDSQSALDKLSRILGLEKARLEISGPNGGPIETSGQLDTSNGQLLEVIEALKSAGALEGK